MAGEALTPTTYIQHHLKSLTAQVGGEGPFWTINVDTFVTAVLMGLLIVFAFWLATRKATAGVPGRSEKGKICRKAGSSPARKS